MKRITAVIPDVPGVKKKSDVGAFGLKNTLL